MVKVEAGEIWRFVGAFELQYKFIDYEISDVK